MLSLWDALRPSTHTSTKVTSLRILRPTCDFLQTHLQEPEFIFWLTSDAFCKRPVLSYQGSYVKFWRGDLRAKVVPKQATYWVTWGVPRRVPQVSLQADSALTRRHEQKPQGPWRTRWPQEKGHWGNQPWLTRITPTALLGSWVLQLIEVRRSSGLTSRSVPYGKGQLRNPLQRIL